MTRRWCCFLYLVTGDDDLQGTSVPVIVFFAVFFYSLFFVIPMSLRERRLTHGTFNKQMDPWIGTVPGVVCSSDGPCSLRPAFAFGPEAPIYGRILWIHCTDFLFLSGGESTC